MPDVLMKILSPLPLFTTFVSPVTICTPARSAARRMAKRISCNSVMGKPSSIIKPTLSTFGSAPAMAKSLTVPLTANSPMFPPGKKTGCTTKESVLNAKRLSPKESVA